MSSSPKLKHLILLAVAFVCLHASLMAAVRTRSTIVTDLFFIFSPGIALFATCRKARTASFGSRLPWILFSAALLLWVVGALLSEWEEVIQHSSVAIAGYSDFAFFLYGVPILLAISSPPRKHRISLFVWLDGIQAVLTAYLTYITLFDAVPFAAKTIHPISESLLAAFYDAENLVLPGAATLSILAHPEKGEERRFFKVLSAFLWIYAVCAGVYNHSKLLSNNPALLDAIANIPFLFLAIVASLPASREDERSQVESRTPIALFINTASPILYTLALVTLGLVVLRTHFYIGEVAIVIGLAAYGVRTTVLQSRYLQSQQALQEARDRLEEISLTDGLTNVANRRRFDQILEQEWNRAIRTRQPLSLLLIDIDFFKNVNDRYGHQYGDLCLVKVSSALQTILPRSGDLLARYGGEEFAVVLPTTDEPGAKSVAEKLQTVVRSLNIQNETSLGQYVTISIGLTTYEFPNSGTLTTLLEASDRALYKAKQNGRNRIEISSTQADPNTDPATTTDKGRD